jgi:hypothetical protein
MLVIVKSIGMLDPFTVGSAAVKIVTAFLFPCPIKLRFLRGKALIAVVFIEIKYM